MTTCVSLAELAAAGIQLRPDEAAGIVVEVCRQFISGRLQGLPSPGIIRFTQAGEVVVLGPITPGDAGVARAAHLLNDLLPDFEAPADYRARGGLRLVIARALRTLDLPPYGTLDDFCAALARFAVPDLAARARGLFDRWESARATPIAPASPAPLTISDIRRARRATGLSLDDLSAVADVPAARLRELEWGYFRNWLADDDARAQVVRYARAAGLDDAIVLSIAWPMIEEASVAEGEEDAAEALVASGPQAVITVEPVPVKPRSRLAEWTVPATAAALVALGTFAVAVESSQSGGAVRAEEAVNVPAVSHEAPRVDRPVRVVAAPAPPAPRRHSAARPGPRPAPAPKARPPARTKGFFGRELFRIVIR